jgi:hypothetical protein
MHLDYARKMPRCVMRTNDASFQARLSLLGRLGFLVRAASWLRIDGAITPGQLPFLKPRRCVADLPYSLMP